MIIQHSTDIHLDSIPDSDGFAGQYHFARKLCSDADVVLLGGDISTGTKLKLHLNAFLRGANCPVFFVLGNHDFWYRDHLDVLSYARELPGYIGEGQVKELTPNCAVIGCSGWYDARAGDYRTSKVVMPETTTVPSLRGLWPNRESFVAACRSWADSETAKVRPNLIAAASKYEKLYVVTHYPLWEETCWDMLGRVQRDTRTGYDWLPWSINSTLGELVLEVAANNPNTEFQVCSGHTHGFGEAMVAPNVYSYGGPASFGVLPYKKTWVEMSPGIGEGSPIDLRTHLT